MGQGFYSQCTNNWGKAFTGTTITSQCMIDLDNLATLANGYTSHYFEEDMTGNCFFDTSYFVEGFALPGVPIGKTNLMLAASSPAGPSFSWSAPWSAWSQDWGNWTIYLVTLPKGVQANVTGITSCGSQWCIAWEIVAPPIRVAEDSDLLCAPANAIVTPRSTGSS